MRAVLQKALAPVLPALAVDIVAGHSHLHRGRLFAEKLHRERYGSRTMILCRELYDAKKDALREPHIFWDYLSQAPLPTCAEPGQGRFFCDRPLGRFAQGFHGLRIFQVLWRLSKDLLLNVSMDEWPHVLENQFCYGHLLASRVYFSWRRTGRSSSAGLSNCWERRERPVAHYFCALNAVNPALLQGFFRIGLSAGLFKDMGDQQCARAQERWRQCASTTLDVI